MVSLHALGSNAVVRFFGSVIDGFVAHNDLTLAASISYYTALSLAPLLVLVLWGAASVSADAQLQLTGEIGALMGAQVGPAVQAIIDHAAQRPSFGSIAGLFGAILLVLAASGVFSQLQTALNIIWSTPVADAKGAGRVFWGWLRRRLLAIGILAAFAFLLIVSLVANALIALALPFHGRWWDIANQCAIVVVFTGLFAALFRYLPDARLSWRSVWAGALVTSVLFAAGKYLIEEYLSHSGIAGAYGPAGSFAVLLVWVYYSATIFLFGAECVRVFAQRRAEH